jgi:xanthine dehydrogenase molybdopterin-binding subunit B
VQNRGEVAGAFVKEASKTAEPHRTGRENRPVRGSRARSRHASTCAAGRILNPKSARSQVIGAMTMGAGAALMEELAVDKRHDFFVNHDLAGYEVPVHADIPHQEVIFLDETDPMSSPMKAKGVGELGIRQRDLQCRRRAGARLSGHARQAARAAAGGGVMR